MNLTYFLACTVSGEKRFDWLSLLYPFVSAILLKGWYTLSPFEMGPVVSSP